MDHCNSCAGNCKGCDRSLVLTKAEIDMLTTFSQFPFLPVARRADDMTPIYLEEADKEYSLILSGLEQKGLIDIDYHTPLSGFDYRAYEKFPLQGSMALTARGQSVIETLEIQGAAEETQ